jgi:hypothetical protein
VQAKAMVEVAKLPQKKADEDTDGLAFLRAIGFARGAFDTSEGVPRLVVISPMKLPILNRVTDRKTARERGFQAATKIGSDLQRAEIYITGLAAEAGRFAPDFANAFFLGLKGQVIATSGETLPTFLDPPTAIAIYGGFIDYVGVKVPMQLRFAVDSSGSLVNSWVEVAVVKPIATPISGKALCRNNEMDSCTYKGEILAQNWVEDVKSEPTFDDKLPFSGVRHLEFSTSPDGLKGKAYDPNVVFNGNKDLQFQLSRTENIKF